MANIIKGLLPSGKAPSVLKNEIEGMIKAQSPDLSSYATKKDLEESSGVKNVSGAVTLTQADGPLTQVFATASANVNGELLRAGDIALFRITGSLVEVRVLDTDYAWRPVGSAPVAPTSPTGPVTQPPSSQPSGSLPGSFAGLVSNFDATDTAKLTVSGGKVTRWEPTSGSASTGFSGADAVYQDTGMGGYPTVTFPDSTSVLSYPNPALDQYTQYMVMRFDAKDKRSLGLCVNGLGDLSGGSVNFEGVKVELASPVIVILTYDSAAGSKLFVSKAAESIRTYSAMAGTRRLQTHTINHTSAVSQYGFYNRVLTDDEILALGAGLKAKWKIS